MANPNIPKNLNDQIPDGLNQFRFTKFVQDLYTWTHQILAVNNLTNLAGDVSGAPGANLLNKIDGANIRIVTANDTVTANDFLVVLDSTGGTFNEILPLAASVGKKIIFMTQQPSSNQVYIAPTSGDSYYGQNSLSLAGQGLLLMSDGVSKWYSLNLPSASEINGVPFAMTSAAIGVVLAGQGTYFQTVPLQQDGAIDGTGNLKVQGFQTVPIAPSPSDQNIYAYDAGSNEWEFVYALQVPDENFMSAYTDGGNNSVLQGGSDSVGNGTAIQSYDGATEMFCFDGNTWQVNVNNGSDAIIANPGYFEVILSTSTPTWAINSCIYFNNTATQINGSISGTIKWSMQFQGVTMKKVIIQFNAFHDAGTTITFPTAFSSTPIITANNSGLTISTLTASAITIPASIAASGWIILEGF